MWTDAGWDGPEDFETWWGRLVANHPNKNRNACAKTKAIELVKAGVLRRSEFDRGYASLRAANAGRWSEQGGRYAPNLYQLLEDHAWKHAPPVTPAACEYQNSEDYQQRIRCE